MSTYLTVESALLDLVRGYNSGATFTASNSARDDWNVLTAQGKEVAVIVEMGAATKEGDSLSKFGNEVQEDGYGGQGLYNELHTLDVWVCIKRGQGTNGDAAQKATLKTLTESLKDYLRPFRTFNIGAPIADSWIVSTTEPAGIAKRNRPEDSTHLAQVITIRVMCQSDAPDWEGP